MAECETLDRNLLSTSDFRIIFGPIKQLRSLDIFAISVNLPSVSMDALPTPHRQYAGFSHGGKINYDQLNIRFACDEKMELYEDIFNWVCANTTVPTEPPTRYPDVLSTADIKLQILKSSLGTTKEITFVRAFPTNIAPMEFSVQNTEPVFANFDVTFNYDYFTFDGACNDASGSCEIPSE